MAPDQNENPHDKWNKIKKLLADSDKNFNFNEGEFWWCSVGMNLGEEIYGKGRTFSRPVLVLRKVSNFSCIALPLSKRLREGTGY